MSTPCVVTFSLTVPFCGRARAMDRPSSATDAVITGRWRRRTRQVGRMETACPARGKKMPSALRSRRRASHTRSGATTAVHSHQGSAKPKPENMTV
jgi:hypothetical protein